MSQHANTTVFTDGACAGNPGRGGWAWAVAPGGEPCGSGGAAHTTNQRMELQAVLEALRSLPGELTIVSDSTYVVHCFRDRWWVKWKANGWKNSQKQPVANTDIWMPLVELVQQRQPTFRWVKGHSGDTMNDLVDRLAVEASKGPFDAPAPAAAPEPPAQSSLFD
jgi:ribonuclease HI